MRCSLSTDLNIMDLLQGEHPEILAGIVEGCAKSGFWHTKALISLKRGKIGPRLLLTIAFDWCENQRPWMTLKGHTAPCYISPSRPPSGPCNAPILFRDFGAIEISYLLTYITRAARRCYVLISITCSQILVDK